MKEEQAHVNRRSTRSPRRPDLGWVLSILALLVMPVASWHEATTVHEICAEHGEVLDVAAPLEHAEDAEAAGPQWSASDEEHGEHELCPFLQLGQPTSPPPETPLGAGRPVETAVATPRVEHARHASVPLLCLAPKQSPPV